MTEPLHIEFRPNNLDEVYGNKHLVDQLKSFIERGSDEIPHSFLFHGPSGCGKTTLARIMAKELGCNIEFDLIEVNSANKLSFSASDGTSTDTITGDTELVAETWYHAAVTADRDGNLTLYLNGSIDATAIAMTTVDLTNSTDFCIGKKDTDYLYGLLAYVSSSGIARSSEYISDVAQTPKYMQSVIYDSRILM